MTHNLPKLLLIDDNDVDREHIRRLVGTEYVWVEAGTAAEALRRSQSEHIDCIILDYRLPDRDGVDIIGEFLSRHQPVVMLTGQGAEDVAVQAMKAGASDYLVKGRITGEDLRRAIRFAIRERELEAQLRQSQKMEAVGRLAGGVAHDFNNILTAIFSFAEFAMESVGPDHPAHEDIEQIEKAALRAEELTRQLLAFSRRRTVEAKILDPNDLLESLHKMLGRLVGEDVELEIRMNSSGTIRVDPTGFEQILVNLVVNARDAMPTGGKLFIETRDTDVTEEHGTSKGVLVPPGRYLGIAVSDTGVGMDEETQQHIFEPFFTTKAANKGTGLGLSTVYGIVKQAGGYIWPYSEKGLGTTFRVYLPHVEGKGAPVEIGEESPRTVGGSERILVVEDDEQIRDLTVRALCRLGYQVVVESPESIMQSIGASASEQIDLLLTDVVMPGVSGKQVAKHLARAVPYLKVLFMSGYAGNVLGSHGVLQEGVQLLEKPFSPPELAAAVRRVLDGDFGYARELDWRRSTILIVEDDPKMLGALRRALDHEYDVLEAPTAQEATSTIKRSPPDIILCDYRLPRVNGRDFYDTVLALNPRLAETFVFMTGVAGPELLEFVKTTDRPVLHKPFLKAELLEVLRELPCAQ